MIKQYQKLGAVAWAAGARLPNELIGLFRNKISEENNRGIEAIFAKVDMAVTTAAGGSCSNQEMYNALGIVDFVGRFGESMRFLSGVRWQTLFEVAARKGYTQENTDMSDVGAGVGPLARTLYVPLYACKSATGTKPMDTAMPPEIFDKAKFTFSFGALPPNLGVGGAFTATIQIFVKYQWRKGIYISPLTEIIEEDKFNQTDILIPSNYYQFISHRSNPILSATPADTIKFANGSDILIDNLMYSELHALPGVDFAQGAATPYMTANLGTITHPRMNLLFSNDEILNEATKGMPIATRDNWKLDTNITGFVSNTIIRERQRSLYDDANLIAECFENRNIKLNSLIPEASPYAPHIVTIG